MADSSKFDKIAMYPVAELDAVQYLITNRLPEHYRDIVEKKQIELCISGTGK